LALASLRLARRQFVAWGHPETSGLPTIDGYFSAELFEPHDAQDHYTERLIRLPNLGVHYQPYATEPANVDLRSLGIDGEGPVLICPGVPFKYAPEDDHLFIEIAQRLRQCTFVFFRHESAELSRKLHGRLDAAFTAAQLDGANHLRLIPWQPRPAFFGLLQRADVYLDTIGFSGFNTMMQAIECDLPCVTLQGKFMRGRLGSGILTRLGLTGWIAHDKQQYIDLVVALGSDAATRANVRASIRRGKAAAYEDMESIEGLTRVLLESRTQ
jgi:predicted O-linked N-acetylglucosamine transferase (SPINDLY family)